MTWKHSDNYADELIRRVAPLVHDYEESADDGARTRVGIQLAYTSYEHRPSDAA